MHPFTILAQVADVNPTTLLVAYGPMGIMLVWFMWRFEAMIKAFRSLSHQIEGMSKVLLVEVMSRPSTTPATRQVATNLLADMERRGGSRPPIG